MVKAVEKTVEDEVDEVVAKTGQTPPNNQGKQIIFNQKIRCIGHPTASKNK